MIAYSWLDEASAEAAIREQVGSYLVFFPSYAYLTAVHEQLKERLPEGQLLVQDRGMSEAARESFLERFSAGSTETVIGLAVMGGVFGEGIDLVGDRLIGAVDQGAFGPHRK